MGSEMCIRDRNVVDENKEKLRRSLKEKEAEIFRFDTSVKHACTIC